ncbi:hypothetical protein [Mycobacterium sp.]|uniref:hypothetical protein n=1 Tax=Mycobacterium sp. TaxID=1785 RepID=UPI0012895E2A|nr:hypothetical protein [Mycobacterium sp.]KAA8966042.1 MAG: hypothetical protein F6Q13_08005 [Mycobacterium sp.]
MAELLTAENVANRPRLQAGDKRVWVCRLNQGCSICEADTAAAFLADEAPALYAIRNRTSNATIKAMAKGA